MTKRVMVKRLMQRFDISKKEANDYLRRSNWDFGKACSMIELPDKLKQLTDALGEIDWNHIFKTILDSVADVAKRLSEIDWNDCVKQIGDDKHDEG